MKSFIYKKYGSLDELKYKELTRPNPKDNEVLIKVCATTVTISDIMLLTGKPFLTRFFSGLLKPKRKILGSEFAGIIESTGKKVRKFKKGDGVYGFTGSLHGCHAEYVCMPEKGVIEKKPPNIAYEESAQVCGAVAAWNFLKNQANIQKGQKILIIGAAGNIGIAAIQIAKYYGAEVTGTCSSKNVELLQSLGVDTIINFTKKEFTKRSEKYDIIFDVENRSSFKHSKKSLTSKGIYLKTFPGFKILAQNLWTSVFYSKKAKFSATGLLPVSKRMDMLNKIKRLIENGDIKLIIHKQFLFADIKDAFNYIKNQQEMISAVINIAK